MKCLKEVLEPLNEVSRGAISLLGEAEDVLAPQRIGMSESLRG
jgi:hypothetical protein